MASIEATSPMIFFVDEFSLKATKPIIAEQRTIETFVIASTVESFQPVV